VFRSFNRIEGCRLLTEQEVGRSWNRLFAGGVEVTSETFEKAEALLEEIKRMKSGVVAKTKAKKKAPAKVKS
jgi:hypothetical protein